jgi:hypothetical protein
MDMHSMDSRQKVNLVEEGRRLNMSPENGESADGFRNVAHAEQEIKSRAVFGVPWRQNQAMGIKDLEVYEGGDIQRPDVND